MLLSSIKVLICPNELYSSNSYVEKSHKGLIISALNTAKVLRANGVNTVVRPVRSEEGIAEFIKKENPTHVIVNALWVNLAKYAELVNNYSDKVFSIIVHSNAAFLQVEPRAIKSIRELIDLECASLGNFFLAGNSRRFKATINDTYEAPCTYLPNLYFLDDTVNINRRKWSGGTLRIGSFGAQRPLKNPTVSAFAALSIAQNLGTNLEYHINIGRNDGSGEGPVNAVDAILQGLPNVKVVKDPWDSWTSFRRLVRNMHLLLQPSFTESFNIVTADGVAEGVASVTSDVIEWVPEWWKSSPDDTEGFARTGLQLLNDNNTGRDGLAALVLHNQDGVRKWIEFLT